MNLSIFMEKKRKEDLFFNKFFKAVVRRHTGGGSLALRCGGRCGDGGGGSDARYCNNYYLSTAALKMDWQIQGLPNN